jgi:hypothetical protein
MLNLLRIGKVSLNLRAFPISLGMREASLTPLLFSAYYFFSFGCSHDVLVAGMSVLLINLSTFCSHGVFSIFCLFIHDYFLMMFLFAYFYF